MTCPYCRTRNQSYAAFCLDCGAALGADAPPALRRVIVRAPAASVTEAVRRRLRAAWPLGARWVGGGVVVGLIGLVVAWQSLHGWQATGYRTGQRAEREHQWEAARMAYQQLGDYSDAPARRLFAQGQINTRNQLVDGGQAAADRMDWARAMAAWQEAAAIAPGYGDLPARLVQAQREIAARAAAGLIYRTVGSQAGLYLQGAVGVPAARLPHSDGTSVVLAYAPAGDQAVYDSMAAGGPSALYLAQIDPHAATIHAVQRLPARLPAAGWGVFYPGGLWWMRESAPTLSDYTAVTGQATAVPFAPGVSLLTADATHGQLLLQEAYPAADGPHSRLLLAAHDGSAARVLSDDGGTIRNATLSPDGRWVLYERERRGALIIFGQSRQGYGLWWPPDRPDAITTRLLLRWIDPDDGSLPLGPGGLPLERERMLDHLVLPDDAPAGGSSVGAFAPGRPATVVVNHSDRDGREISIYAAASGVQTSFWPGPAPAAAQAGPFFSPSGAYLLVMESATDGAQVRVRPLDGSAQTPTRVVPVAAPAGSLILSQITLHDDALLTLVSPPHSGRASVRYTLTRRPLGAGIAGPVQPLLDALYRPGPPDQPTITLAPSGTLLAYIRPDGTLIGQPLAAGPALTLATGVRDVWSPLP